MYIGRVGSRSKIRKWIMDQEKLLLTLKVIYNTLYKIINTAGIYNEALEQELISITRNIDELEESIKKNI